MSKNDKRKTVRETLYWAYANLAMAHSAVSKKQKTYNRFNFMIRSKLFKGLVDESMNIRTMFDDEKVKPQTGQICNYCGSTKFLALDHIFPQKMGGEDNAKNLIYACRSCNSSKGKKDLMEWMDYRKQFLPLMIIRRYLKLTFEYCATKNLLELQLNELDCANLPFKIEFLPYDYPNPSELLLNIKEQ